MPTQRLLILGCGGFIGSHLLDRLLARADADVVGWDPETSKIEHLLNHPRLTLRQMSAGTAAARSQLREDIVSTDWVVNLAAICNPSFYNTAPLRTISAKLPLRNPQVAPAATMSRCVAGVRRTAF